MRHQVYSLGAARLITILALAFALPASGYGPHTIPATKYVRPGDHVILNQDIVVGGGSRIYIQHGKTADNKSLQHREPYCYFHVYRDSSLVATPLSVAADRFQINKTGRGVEYSMDATPGYLMAGFGFFNQDASAQNLMIRFALSSESQPEVRWLKCGVFAVLNERNFLTIEEIREVLGDLVTLEPAAQ